jgi:hypothetical protein
MTKNVTDAVRIVRSHGFTVDNVDGIPEIDDLDIDCPEVTFTVHDAGVGVTMWSGAYPFANDHDMGSLPSLPEAVRYASWLLKRESFYDEQATRLLEEACDRMEPIPYRVKGGRTVISP